MIDNKDLPILIVDDNVQYAQLLKRILESGFGFSNVTSLPGTKEAKELIQEQPERFKMLFVDYNFPDGVSGGELLEHLSKGKLLDGKAAFLITSEPSNQNVEQASQAGALGVVVKPFNRGDLELKIAKALRHLAGNVDSF
jgi:CheY-like chemotaxis protein